MKPIKIDQTKEYVSKFDDEKDKTTFTLGALDSFTLARIMDEFTVGEGENKNQKLYQQAIELCRYGLKNAKGGSLPWKMNDGRPTDDVLRVIPTNVLLEIGNQIYLFNMLSHEEAATLK